MPRPYPLDTVRKLNVHKTFRRRPGRLRNVLCTFKRLMYVQFTSCAQGVVFCLVFWVKGRNHYTYIRFYLICTKMKFSIKDVFSNLVIFTEEILNGKLHFLCIVKLSNTKSCLPRILSKCLEILTGKRFACTFISSG